MRSKHSAHGNISEISMLEVLANILKHVRIQQLGCLNLVTEKSLKDA
jgi:hypothetical protein